MVNTVEESPKSALVDLIDDVEDRDEQVEETTL